MKDLTATVEALTASVESEKTVIESAVALINGFPDTVAAAVAKALADAGINEDDAIDHIEAARAAIDATVETLRNAVTANTATPEAA